MNTYNINTIEDCKRLHAYLKDKQYQFFQCQYSFDDPEGFHAWYMDYKNSRIEVITRNEKIEKALIRAADKLRK